VLMINVDPNFTHEKNDSINTPTEADLEVRYIQSSFGGINTIKNLFYFTPILLEPIRNVSIFCKDLIMKGIQQKRQNFVLLSFFNPELPVTELARHIGENYPEIIGDQLELMGGYDKFFPVLLYSKEYFMNPKKKSETEKIITQNGGYSGIRHDPTKLEDARRAFAEQSIGVLFSNLNKISATDLFKTSKPDTKAQPPTASTTITPAFDVKKTDEAAQQKNKPPSNTNAAGGSPPAPDL
jgi:hypothetical protein